MLKLSKGERRRTFSSYNKQRIMAEYASETFRNNIYVHYVFVSSFLCCGLWMCVFSSTPLHQFLQCDFGFIKTKKINKKIKVCLESHTRHATLPTTPLPFRTRCIMQSKFSKIFFRCYRSLLSDQGQWECTSCLFIF